MVSMFFANLGLLYYLKLLQTEALILSGPGCYAALLKAVNGSRHAGNTGLKYTQCRQIPNSTEAY
jgi:hypothetical protein